MKSATVRDLRNQFARISGWLDAGETVEITKNGKLYAQLLPVAKPCRGRPPMPDFLQRMAEYMNAPLPLGVTDSIVDYDRGDR